MRILLSGGGTGGHVYPVLTVVEYLRTRSQEPDLSFLFLGRRESIEEELCRRYGVPFHAVSAGPLREARPFDFLRNSVRLFLGILESWRALSSFKPEVALVTGGHVSVPAIVSSWLQGCPILVYLPDLEPGLTIRKMARFAKNIAVSFPETATQLGPKAVVTGYPVREDFYRLDRGQARARLGLPPEEPVLLVLGGSRGAHSINVAISQNLRSLLSLAWVIHICGQKDLAWLDKERGQLPTEMQRRYLLFPYLHEIAEAMVSADLAIARAGAATLAEFPAVGLPAILVPYPYSGRHQEANADYMVEKGAALKVADNQLSAEVVGLVTKLLSDRPALAEMSQKARRLAHPDAAANIAALLQETALKGRR